MNLVEEISKRSGEENSYEKRKTAMNRVADAVIEK